MIVKDKADRDVDVGGDVWIFYSALKRFEIDWSTVAELPPFLTDAAKRYAIRLLRSGAPSSVHGFFRGSIRPLLRCASAQRPAEALTERTYDELRGMIAHDKASLQRFRKFYRYSTRMRLSGFDRESGEVMDSVKIGQHRAPAAGLGRNPPLAREETDFLHEQLIIHRDSLPLDGRVALGLSLARGPNAGPMALARGDDLSDTADGPDFGVAQHKKGHRTDRFELLTLPIGDRLAGDIRALAAHNAELASRMVWPDGTVGLPAGIEIPLFMRPKPKGTHAAVDCPVREYALHMTPNEVSALIRDTVVALCFLGGADPIDMTARTGKRTLLTEAQRQGLPPEVIAFLGGHRSTRHVGNYAAEGLSVLEHVERAVGDRIADICASYATVAPAFAGVSDEIVLKLRKTKLGRE